MGEVTFCGACGSVTGSSTLLRWGDTRLLIDCGLYQGNDELEQLNWRQFVFEPHELSAVLLTHAHLDHTGLLPRLVAEGFEGPIYCSRASRGLVSLILQDAGKIQEEQARYAAKKGHTRFAEPKPLYTAKDSRAAIKLLRRLEFDKEHEILPGIRVRLRRAGHLLGAASLEVSAKGGDGERRTWCFSGDVGRYDVPIIKDPEPPLAEPAALVLESTYGDRDHRQTDPEAAFRELIQRVFRRGGMVIIPAFALGRTQEVLYHLSALVDDNLLDPNDVFLDSPMAIKATDIYKQAESEHDEDLRELVEQHLNPLSPDRFNRCRKVDESKRLNSRRQPAVIVASSGMATGGRVVHHLKRRLADDRNAVVFVGYQAGGTRGRALTDGAPSVAIHGDRIAVRAEISSLHGLSAHADQEELVRWCRDLPAAPPRVFLNHGEDPARKVLAAVLAEEDGWSRPHLPWNRETAPW
jgi:metallo-beta-lactamase family protein